MYAYLYMYLHIYIYMIDSSPSLTECSGQLRSARFVTQGLLLPVRGAGVWILLARIWLCADFVSLYCLASPRGAGAHLTST